MSRSPDRFGRVLTALVSLAVCAVMAGGRPISAGAQTGAGGVDRAALTAQVKAELLRAWRTYERDAWGHDELRPLTHTPYDWYGESLDMTPVDALDTLILMGLDREAGEARRLIDETLSFDRNIYVKTFEIDIRLLGGLLSAYELTGDARLLALATDLGNRLLPAFESPTGLPYQFVNLRTGQVRGADTNPAETGTLILEFGTLSRLTGNRVYLDKAKRALVATYARRSPIGLVGDGIDVNTGLWTATDSHVGGGIDSYYEYLVKCDVLFEDQDCAAMWRSSRPAIERYLADEVAGRLWYGHADMTSGRRTATTYSALAAFFPAVLALSGDVRRARQLQESSFAMWQLNGIEPEVLDYRTMTVVRPGYHLRPEIVESTYYLYRYTHDPRYLEMGRTLFLDFVKSCRTPDAFASLQSVVTKQQADQMPTFLFAETFKYFYLLFAPPSTLDFDRVVFNTEAHPLRRPQHGPSGPFE
ncbi:MAG: glycoside hydrolase family 47 protein [Betaproteobacteria bacterium]